VVNTRQKGNRLEREASEQLQNQGYKTSRMPHTRYGENDILGQFDILASKPDAPFKLIQVKANQASKLAEFKKSCRKNIPFQHAEIEYWIKYDYQGWEKRRLNKEGTELKTFVDERKD